MAITLRSSNGIVEDFDFSNEQTNHTVNISDAAVGDVRFIAIAYNPDGTGTVPNAVTLSGWTQCYTSLETGAASGSRLSIFYRVVQSGDTLTSATISFTFSAICMYASESWTLEGVDTTNVLDTASQSDDASNSTLCPSITTVTDGAWVFTIVDQDGTSGALVDGDIPSSHSLIGTINNNPPSNGINLGVSYFEKATAGSTGTMQWGNADGEETVLVTMAIRPGPTAIYQITGTLKDGASTLANVSVWVLDTSGNKVASGTTNGSGVFTITVPALTDYYVATDPADTDLPTGTTGRKTLISRAIASAAI